MKSRKRTDGLCALAFMYLTMLVTSPGLRTFDLASAAAGSSSKNLSFCLPQLVIKMANHWRTEQDARGLEERYYPNFSIKKICWTKSYYILIVANLSILCLDENLFPGMSHNKLIPDPNVENICFFF